MKKVLSLVLIMIMMLSLSVASFAGGPEAHGLSGREFGQAVRSLPPGAISAHVSGNEKGMPFVHGLTGKEFGQAVRAMEPGTVSDHVK